MRKNCKKSWMTAMLVFCMSVLMVFATQAEDSNATTVSELSDGSVVQTVADITEYRIKDNFKAPNAPTGYENYIFSGWYTDETCTSKKALAVTVTSENIGGNTLAYAKFVPKEVLGVRAQVRVAKKIESDETDTRYVTYGSDGADIRFVTSVDSANYKAVGFDCVQNGKSMNGESNSAYQKLQVLNNQGKIMNYTPWNVFHSMSKYFMAATLPNVINADFGDGIAVTPYWITLDGTKVPGETVTKTINMSYTSSMEAVATAKAFDISRKRHDSHDIYCGLGYSCDNYVPQGGCTDGTYYYQALIYDANTTGDTYDKSYDSSDRVYIRKHDMENDSTVKISGDLNLHHANDITYNPDLQYNGRKGLLVVIQNHPVYTRLSFVHPDDLTVIDPEEITDLNGEKMVWAWPVEIASEETTYTDKYIEFSNASIIKGGIYSINYNAVYKKYVVGLSGGQKFTFLDASLKEEGTVYSSTSKSDNFTTQGNTCDDGYIYFILYGNKMDAEGAELQYNSHIITVYDWDGNFVTVLEIPTDSILLAQEPENISIYDNKIYISCSNGDNATVYQVDKEKITYAEGTVVATIKRGLTTVEYVSLEEAMMDAEANETITIVAENVEVGSQMEMLAENVTLTNQAGIDVTITRKNSYTGTLIDNSAQNFTIKSNDSGSLTFEGTGSKKGDSWIANSVDGELVLENITVQNVSANKNGGAVRVEAGQVTIKDCEFKNNVNSAEGGAIYSNGTLNVEDSVFESNSALNGGAICNRQETAVLNITNCKFGGTTTDENDQTVGLGNTASSSGGAIYNGGSGTVIINGDSTEKSTFEGNQASGSNGGGAICIGTGTLTLDGYAFKNNKATIQGGAIALRGGEKSTISNSSFEGNEAETKYGGAIHNRLHRPTITDCTFSLNNALLYGGAIYNEFNGQVTLNVSNNAEEALLSGNSAGSGGAITNTSGKVSVDGYTFDGNNANKVVIGTETSTDENGTETVTDIYSDAFGGAIYSTKLEDYDTTVETTDCIFKGNTSEANGGAIYNDTSATCIVTDTKFATNKAGADGGAIYNSATLKLVGTKGDEETVTAVFDNNGFVDGATSVRGAAIYNGNTLNATAYVFKNHVTTGNGGAICNYGRNPKFTNCQFISNQGAIGGALYSGGGVEIYLNVSDEAPELTALCEGNIATTRGGAIGVGYGHTYVDGYEFKGNHALYGGALYLENDKKTTENGMEITVGTDSKIENSIFIGNYTNETGGTTGGAVQVDHGEVDVIGCTFNSNTSTTDGGAIYTKAETGIEGCTFTSNASTTHGGAVFAKAVTDVTGCTFTSNHATDQGGAIKVDGAQLSVVETTFGGKIYEDADGNKVNPGNIAETSGGAIYGASNATIIVGTENSTKKATEVFENNKANAGLGGGAICVGTGVLRVYGYSFTDNYAAKEGGAIAKRSDAELTVKGATFESNETGDVGGAIRSYATTSTIENTTFTENIAATRGGAMYTSKNLIVDLDGSSFNNNSAVYGGAINCEGGTLKATSCHFTGNISTAEMTTADAKKTELTGRGGGAVNLTANAKGIFDGTGTFTSNKAENALGGAIYTTDAELSISGYTFSKNVAYHAGAILIDNVRAEDDEALCGTDIEIKDSKFEQNQSTELSGGAIYLNQRELILSKTSETAETVFELNHANGAGGAIDNAGGTLNVSEYKFLQNSATAEDATPAGGAINNTKETTITDCMFDGNTATGNGGAIGTGNSGSSLTLNVSESPRITSVFQNNSSGARGGAIGHTNGTVDIYGYKFLNNSAVEGGAISRQSATEITIQDSPYSLVDAMFKGNNATSGGAIFTTNGTTEITDYTFENNSATNGGAIYAHGGTINPTDCKFGGDDTSLGNTASNEGGAIMILNGSTINLKSDDNASMAIIKNNTADADGGAISVNKGKLYVTGYTFESNNAKGTSNGGGAIYTLGNAGATVELTNSVFTSNIANKNGGAICNNGSNPVITNCKFVGNSSTTGNGGAIYNGWGREVELKPGDATQNIFDGNYTSAGYGGAIGIGSGSLTVEEYTFNSNDAATNGGAIYVTGDAGELMVTSSTFESNTSSSTGGALLIRYKKAMVDDCEFITNESLENNGGAISIEEIKVEDKVIVKNSTFEQNKAKKGEGSSINVPTDLFLTLQNCEFTGGVTKTDAKYSDCGFGDVRIADTIDDGGLKISGKMVADIYFNQPDVLTVSGKLIEGSDVVANWRKDRVTESTYTGIVFDSEADMNASKGYITLSDNQNERYAIRFADTTGTLVTVLSKTKVTTEEEFINELDLIEASDDKIGAVVLGADITISAQRKFPAGCDITIVDDGTPRKFVRSASYMAHMLQVPETATVTFASTGGDNTNPRLMIDGANVACTGANPLLENLGILTVCQGTALQNNQTSGGFQGIALYSQKGSTTTFKGAIRNITSTYTGDASPSSVVVYGTLTFDNAVVENNDTNKNGMVRISKATGAEVGGNLTATNTEFKNNTTGANGGIITVDSSAGSVNFTGCAFTNNKANGGNGGAIYNYGEDTNIINCKFNSNTASGNGGAIYSGGNVTLDITGDGTDASIFYDNKANGTYGGAVGIGTGKVDIDGYKFDTNTAKTNGGAIYITGSTDKSGTEVYSEITNSVFINNTATDNNGGAIYINTAGRVKINTVDFNDNNAENRGGAVCSEGGKFEATNCDFDNNTAKGEGGAYRLANGGTATLTGCTFTNNIAHADKDKTNGGGAIKFNSGTLTIDGCTFSGNQATDGDTYGHDIKMNTDTTLPTIKNSTFKLDNVRNLSGGTGAGIAYTDGGNNTLTE